MQFHAADGKQNKAVSQVTFYGDVSKPCVAEHKHNLQKVEDEIFLDLELQYSKLLVVCTVSSSTLILSFSTVHSANL